LVEPQLVTPTTTLWLAAVPKVVGEVNVGGFPRFTTHGPPLDPPVIREPIIVLFEELALV